jgi:hypothetical protein
LPAHYRLIAAAGLIVVCAACSDPASVVPDELIGSWIITEPHQPQGSMQRILSVSSDGEVVFGVYYYDTYAASSGLSAYSETKGQFRATGDRLDITARTITIWDSFYDDPGPTTTSYGGFFFDDCTFKIVRDQLTLRYLSYPLDAPEQTMLRLNRRR